MASWDDILTERDRKVFKLYGELGCGPKRGFGSRPAVLVIDVNVAFVGDNPNDDILQAMKKYPYASGVEGFQAVWATVSLLKTAREHNIPVIYTTGGLKEFSTGARHGEEIMLESREKITEEIAPEPGDTVIYKSAPSAFFGTSLVQHLRRLDIDTVLCTGCTTSGCVRASVVDAFSYNYKVGVVEECTFDRAQASHMASLHDMHAKYADVISLEQVKHYIRSLRSVPLAVGQRQELAGRR